MIRLLRNPPFHAGEKVREVPAHVGVLDREYGGREPRFLHNDLLTFVKHLDVAKGAHGQRQETVVGQLMLELANARIALANYD